METSIKLQLVTGTSHDFDFRGDKFIGHNQGDEHKTLLERDPASESDIQAIEEHGAEINAALGKLDFQGMYLRIGLFDGVEK